MKLKRLSGEYAVVKLPPHSQLPGWVNFGGVFSSITHTEDEISIVMQQSRVPENIECERDMVCFKVVGPLDFSLTGILANLIAPLANAQIPIFLIATYETDYIFIHERHAGSARNILIENGHEFVE